MRPRAAIINRFGASARKAADFLQVVSKSDPKLFVRVHGIVRLQLLLLLLTMTS
jgi:hypothetical protein